MTVTRNHHADARTSDAEHRADMLAASAAAGSERIILHSSVAAYETEAMRFAFYPKTWCTLATANPAISSYEMIPVYPALAMLGEIGELAEKLHENDNETWSVKKLGDVLWYVAAAARNLGSSLVEVLCGDDWGDPAGADSWLDGAEYRTIRLLAAAGKFAEQHAKKPWRDGSALDKPAALADLRAVLDAMRYVANEFGVTLDQVAQINIDKLVDRRARGKLTGSGDNR